MASEGGRKKSKRRQNYKIIETSQREDAVNSKLRLSHKPVFLNRFLVKWPGFTDII